MSPAASASSSEVGGGEFGRAGATLMRGAVHFGADERVSGVLRFDCCAHSVCVTDAAGAARHLFLVEVAKIDYEWHDPETRRRLISGPYR
jgi:hypothetical protein